MGQGLNPRHSGQETGLISNLPWLFERPIAVLYFPEVLHCYSYTGYREGVIENANPAPANTNGTLLSSMETAPSYVTPSAALSYIF